MDFYYEPALEAQYDVWIAGKKRKSDFLSAILSSLLVLSYRACVYTAECKDTGVHPAGVFVTMACWLWLMLGNPGRYALVRNHVLACMWYMASLTFTERHQLVEKALEPHRTPGASLSILLMAKWPYLLFFMHMYPAKLSWVPLVQFVGLLCMNLGAFNAAAAYDQDFSKNIPIMRLTAAINGTIGALLDRVFQVLNGRSERLVNQGLASDLLLSPRQCALAMWLLLQGAAFWIGFWMLGRVERCNRVAFLRSLRLGAHHAPCETGVQEMRVQLCAVQMYVAVLLLAASGVAPSSLAG